MLRHEDNELLIRVGPGTPAGRMLRQYWVPAIRAAAVEPGGAPVVVRLFGQNFVAFRSPSGDPGFMNEACPHRGVSMRLARNEENGLRCIFHGWKMDHKGNVVETPNEPPQRRDQFAASLRRSNYLVREAAGVLWVFLGEGAAPPFPDFEFNQLAPEQVSFRRAVVPYNWLQAVEAHVDSSHVGFLHSGALAPDRPGLSEVERKHIAEHVAADNAPRFELEETAYGLQEAALRRSGEASTYARIREIALPFHTFIPGPPDGHLNARISVPIDDDTTAEWYVLYQPKGPLDHDVVDALYENASNDPDNFAANFGTSANTWNQDRSLMKEGHWSGMNNVPFEDFVTQASMGSAVDRSQEQLGTADTIIVKVRRMLLDAVREFEQGVPVPWNDARIAYPKIEARSVVFSNGEDWRMYASKGELPESQTPEQRVT